MTKGTKPVGHLLKAGDGASIITKQDAADCGERSLERIERKKVLEEEQRNEHGGRMDH